MKNSFALSIMAALAVAAPGNLHEDASHKAKLAGDPKYSSYAARWNKDVRDTATFSMRQGLYHAANEIIEE